MFGGTRERFSVPSTRKGCPSCDRTDCAHLVRVLAETECDHLGHDWATVWMPSPGSTALEMKTCNRCGEPGYQT